MSNPVGRPPIYPKENCLDCCHCIHDKFRNIDTCTITFNSFEARKTERCKQYSNEQTNTYCKKKVVKFTKKLKKVKRKREI